MQKRIVSCLADIIYIAGGIWISAAWLADSASVIFGEVICGLTLIENVAEGVRVRIAWLANYAAHIQKRIGC